MADQADRPRRLADDLAVGPWAALVDLLVVSVFVVVGRRSHDEGLTLAGWGETAWPFLVGLALGWALVALTLGRLPVTVPTGVPVWLATVFGGMALRDMDDQGTALPFVVVATTFLGVTLLGWRAIARRWLVRPPAPTPSPGGRGRVPRTSAPVPDPIGTRELTDEVDDSPGRGVVPEAERRRYVEELAHDPRTASGDD